MAIFGKATIALLGCLWTTPARTAPQVSPSDSSSLEMEARAGQVRSVLASKITGEYRLRLIRPSGVQDRSLNWRQPPVTTLSWVAVEDGTFKVVCEPLGPPPSIPCELSALKMQSLMGVEVEANLRRGYELLEDWSAQAQEQAEQVFRVAIEGAGALEDTGFQIDSRLGLARTLALRGTPQTAVPLLEEAAAMADSSGDTRRRVLASVQLLQSLVTMAKVNGAEEIAKDLVEQTNGAAFPLGRAEATLGLGDVHYHRSEFSKAEELYRAALDLYESFNDIEGVIDARLTLGYSLADQSRDQEARLQFEEALQKARRIRDRRREALALRVLGSVHSKLGEDAVAIRYLELAQALFEGASDNTSLVTLYNGLGEVHRRVYDLPASLEYYRKARDLARRTSFPHGEGAALLEIGACLRLTSRHEEAVQAFEEARAIFIEMGHGALEGGALAGLGNVYADRREFGSAIDYLRRALPLKIAAGDTREAARILNDLADVYLTIENLDEAGKASHQALAHAQEPAELLQQARALANLAKVLRRGGHLDDARRYLELALDVDEAMRLRVPGAELRALSFQGAEERYGSYVDLLMQISKKNDPNASRLALEAVERSRSRALLDGVRGAFGSASVEGSTSAERLNELLAEVRKLALEADLGVETGGEARTISERLADLRRLRSLATTNAHAPANISQTALPVETIERYFAKDDALLLEYFLGEERSYVWAIGGGRFEVHELSPKKAIEERIQRALALLTARQVDSQRPLREQALRNRESDDAFYREALSLSREILGAVSDIDSFSRLVIVADGALNSFPIGVLAHPQRSADHADGYVPLITTHEVVRAPSVTAMLAMAARAEGRRAKSLIAILADPVFTVDDPRVGAGGSTASRPPDETSTMEASLRGSGRTLASLPRLLASREELSSIASVAPQVATTATDFVADRATAERLLRESYRVVHFATHGVLNDRYPELSGIVLSLVDAQGRPLDGFLRVQDLYGMQIETDLVVLSACETALGHALRGEGITGLVTALMHAGAGSVVASKWRVDDLATRQLMEAFYRGLFLEGLDSAAALRAAQVSLWKRKRTHAPFYWGAFELHGTS